MRVEIASSRSLTLAAWSFRGYYLSFRINETLHPSKQQKSSLHRSHPMKLFYSQKIPFVAFSNIDVSSGLYSLANEDVDVPPPCFRLLPSCFPQLLFPTNTVKSAYEAASDYCEMIDAAAAGRMLSIVDTWDDFIAMDVIGW